MKKILFALIFAMTATLAWAVLYNEKDIPAQGSIKIFDMAQRIIIDNQFNKNPELTIFDDNVSMYPDGTVKHKGLPILREVFTPQNAGQTFNLLNPNDNSTIGVAHYQDVYVLMYSMYWYLKDKAKAAVKPAINSEE